jgi:acyl-CoA reductase-like NAD-dependent aldehyde dehydrogenase
MSIDEANRMEQLCSFVGGVTLRHEGARMTLVRPEDEKPTAVLIEADAAGVGIAAQNAKQTFDANRGSGLYQRSEWLRQASAILKEEAKRIGAIVYEDVGKPIRIAQIEVRRGVEFLDACAAATLNIGGEVVPVDSAANGAGHFGFTRRVPYGVVGAITPFNAPVNLLIQKVAPAIAAGNSVVVKPAPSETRAALALAEMFCRCGWPSGLFNVVTGDRQTALALAENRLVGAISFNGRDGSRRGTHARCWNKEGRIGIGIERREYCDGRRGCHRCCQ